MSPWLSAWGMCGPERQWGHLRFAGPLEEEVFFGPRVGERLESQKMAVGWEDLGPGCVYTDVGASSLGWRSHST